MKSYTDIEQSRKLAKILPIKSADMWYQYTGISIKDGSKKPIYFPMVIRDCESDEDIPCWSLVALLNILPKNLNIGRPSLNSNYKEYYWIQYYDEFMKPNNYKTECFNNPIDACVDMIEKLNELNLL